MAITNNYFNTGTTSAGYINPIIWSPTSEKYLFENAVFQKLGITDPRQLNKPGKQYNYNFASSDSLGVLTEGVAIPVSAITYTQVTVTFDSYGSAKQVSLDELNEGLTYILNDVKYNAFGAMVENRDSAIVTELLNTTTTGIYPGTATSSTIASTDIFTIEVIARVETTMEQSQAKKCDSIVIHPMQKYSIIVSDGFTKASEYGGESKVTSGLLGDYYGVNMYVSNHITTATENSITVYKSIALGRRPFVFMPKRNFVFNFEEETKRERTLTASYWEKFGVKILRNESVIVLTSAGGY